MHSWAVTRMGGDGERKGEPRARPEAHPEVLMYLWSAPAGSPFLQVPLAPHRVLPSGHFGCPQPGILGAQLAQGLDQSEALLGVWIWDQKQRRETQGLRDTGEFTNRVISEVPLNSLNPSGPPHPTESSFGI